LDEFFHVSVKLAPSRWLATWLLSTHGGAGALIAVLSPQAPWLAVLLLPVGVSLAAAWRRHYRLEDPREIVGLGQRGGWTLERRDGRRFAADLDGSQWLSAWLVVLTFRSRASRARYRVLVLPDQVDEWSFRRLIRTVRWQRLESEPGG
jgi:hypothetical protein